MSALEHANDATLEALGATYDAMAQLNSLSAKFNLALEDLAQAFLTLRPELSTNEQALEVLASVAAQSHEMNATATDVAHLIVEASRRPKPAGQIVVHAGDESTRLFDAPESFDGTPDPRAVAMIGEGRVRYHLDSLAALDAEAHGREHKGHGLHVRLVSDRSDVVATTRPPGCGSVGCRQFQQCLCSCRNCRSTCAARKP